MLIAAQIFGITAVALYLLSYQLKKRVHIIWATFIANILYVVQYLLLGAFSGAVMDLLSTIATFLAAKKNKSYFKRHAKWIAVVIEFIIAVTGVIITIIRHNWIEFLPIAGAVSQTVALWCDNEQTIRKLSLCAAPFWLLYNALTKAYGATIGSAFAIVSIIVSLVRYRKGKNDNK